MQQIADIFSVPRSTIYGHLEKASVGGRPRASQSTVGRNPRADGSMTEGLAPLSVPLFLQGLIYARSTWPPVWSGLERGGPRLHRRAPDVDPQVDAVRLMVDAVAERIATLGGTPIGTPGFVAGHRGWADYSILRATTMEHLGALDVVYSGVVKDHRQAAEELDDLDLVTQDESGPVGVAQLVGGDPQRRVSVPRRPAAATASWRPWRSR